MIYKTDYANLLYVDTSELYKSIGKCIEKLRNDMYYYAYIGIHIKDESILKDLVKLMEFGVCYLDKENIKNLCIKFTFMDRSKVLNKVYLIHRNYILELDSIKGKLESSGFIHKDYIISNIYKIDNGTLNKLKVLGVDLKDQNVLGKLVQEDKLITIFKLNMYSNIGVYVNDKIEMGY